MKISILDVSEGVCEVSGRQGEVAVIAVDDEPTPLRVNFKCLADFARFRALQAAKKNGSGATPKVPPPAKA